MPTRPPVHQPAWLAPRREKRERERQRLKDQHRPTAHQRGYDADWRALRDSFLAAYPHCSVEGCARRSTDADHIESVADRPDLRLVWSNLRPFCHQHHASRTARDQGFARRGVEHVADAARASRHPEWLKPSRVPLTILCGPPGSGKSTYVRQHAGPRDMVLDIDVIAAALSGLPLYTPGRPWVEASLRWRNSRLGLLGTVSSRWPHAWLILAEPTVRWRDWWRSTMRPARTLIFAPPIEVCRRRVKAATDRAHQCEKRLEVVESWFLNFERGPLDFVVPYRESNDASNTADR